MISKKTVLGPEYQRLNNTIAQGALTNSKRPECLMLGAYPTVIKSGFRAKVTDVRGEQFIDYIGGLGTNLLGYGNPIIANAIKDQYEKGSIFSMSSLLEVEAAERLLGVFHFANRVKFLKTGTEACMAAVKIARAKKKRTKLLVDGYHGWADMFVDSNPAYGVEPLTIESTYRGVDKYWDELKNGEFAAVIIEPVELDYTSNRINWLNRLREVCTKTETILIFDEIITGFRYKNYSVSREYSIDPDILCLGKAMGGGLPLAAVLGKKEIMECEEYFVSSTFAGDCIALKAMITTMDLLQTNDFSLNILWNQGMDFLRRFNKLNPNMIMIKGYPTRGRFFGDVNFLHLFWQETARAGILFGPSWFYNFALPEHDDEVINVCSDIIANINAGRVELTSQRPVSPFANSQRKS